MHSGAQLMEKWRIFIGTQCICSALLMDLRYWSIALQTAGHITIDWWNSLPTLLCCLYTRAVPDLYFSNPAEVGFCRIWNDKSGRSQSRIFKL